MFKKNDPRRRFSGTQTISKELLKKACDYVEIHRIRERIMAFGKAGKVKTIMVTSPHDGAGNTMTVAVLGLNLTSFNQMKVLLVDMNMRMPQLHQPFDLKKEKGFSDVSSGNVSWKEVVKKTEIKGLRVITAGSIRNDQVRSLNRPPMDTLIREMTNYFDMVIFDTSPILVHNRRNEDPALLSFFCDMVLIMVMDKMTTRSQLEKTMEALPREAIEVSGIIYNQFKT